MFGKEVDLVWKSKWSFMKGLYLFQRYLPFIDITIILYCQSDFFPILSSSFLSFLDIFRKNLTRSVCRKLAFSSGGS